MNERLEQAVIKFKWAESREMEAKREVRRCRDMLRQREEMLDKAQSEWTLARSELIQAALADD